MSLARSEAGLQHQLTPVQLYCNLCLPHQGLPQAGREERVRTQAQTPAKALCLTDQLWRLDELLLIRVPHGHRPAWPLPACLGNENRARTPQKPDPRACHMDQSCQFWPKMAPIRLCSSFLNSPQLLRGWPKSGCSSILGRERSGEGIVPVVADCCPLDGWQMGRHKACPYGRGTGDGAKHGRRGWTPSYSPQSHCGASRTGGVAGAEPPHKGGRLRPTAQKSEERGKRSEERELPFPLTQS